MKVSYVRAVMLGLILVAGLAVSGVGEDFDVISNTEGTVSINIGSGYIPHMFQCFSEERYEEITSMADSLNGSRKWSIESNGNTLVSTDGGLTWAPIIIIIGLNIILKFPTPIHGALFFEPPDSLHGAYINQHFGDSVTGIQGSIHDGIVLRYDGYRHLLSGSEVFPPDLDLDFPIERVAQRITCLGDGSMQGSAILRFHTFSKGLVEIPVNFNGSFDTGYSRITLPAVLESSYAVTTYNATTGDWEGEGEVLVTPYNGSSFNAPTLNEIWVVVLLGLLLLSGVTVLVVRRNRASAA